MKNESEVIKVNEYVEKELVTAGKNRKINQGKIENICEIAGATGIIGICLIISILL